MTYRIKQIIYKLTDIAIMNRNVKNTTTTDIKIINILNRFFTVKY